MPSRESGKKSITLKFRPENLFPPLFIKQVYSAQVPNQKVIFLFDK